MPLWTATIANASTGAAAPAGGGTAALLNIGMLVLMFVAMYFLILRPQQQKFKKHQQMIAGLKRGDTVVTYGGLIGKIRSLDDTEVRVELSPNVEVRVVRGMISEVRNRSEPTPANDVKAS